MDNVILLYKRGGLIYTAYSVVHSHHVEFNTEMDNIFDDNIPVTNSKNTNLFTNIFQSDDGSHHFVEYNPKTVASIKKIEHVFPHYHLTTIWSIRNNNNKSFGIKNDNKHCKDIRRINTKYKSINTNKIKRDIHQVAKDYGYLVGKNVEQKLIKELHL